ncbi:MAG: ferredoxin [Streptomyces sp.]|uniref:ferredoxin n=1 Tax=Streptomyces sp. TaxID=1931 RepID=UPI003D6B18AE
MKVTVDQETCVGSGQCALAAADVFDQRDEDGIVALLDPAPPGGLAADVNDAAAMCPVQAITVEE